MNEQRRIGARQPLRIGRAQGIGEMRAAAPDLPDMGLERRQSLAIEKMRRDPVLSERLDVAARRVFPFCGAPDLDPSCRPQEVAGACGLRQPAVLVRRAENQWLHRGGGLAHPRRAGELEILPERLGVGRQRAVADVGARVAVHRRVGDLGRIAGKGVGDHRLALHQSGVAVARLVARLAVAVDQRHPAPARLQGERRADADHAGAQDNDIDAARRHRRTLISAGRRLRRESRSAFLTDRAGPRR